MTNKLENKKLLWGTKGAIFGYTLDSDCYLYFVSANRNGIASHDVVPGENEREAEDAFYERHPRNEGESNYYVDTARKIKFSDFNIRVTRAE